MSTELATTDQTALTGYADFSIAHVIGQTKAIKEVMAAVMKDGEHYGVIPGTKGKPTLLQPGAEKLIMLFWLEVSFETVERIVRDDFIMYEVRAILRHRKTGEKWGEGMGACNSKEKRYQSQTNEKVCPKCSKPAIIKGKKEYGGGWLCWDKKGGCKAKFTDDDQAIVEQEGQTKKDSVYDLQNTIYKMACKRAKVAVVLNATAASDVFTQDLEDLSEVQAQYIPPKDAAPPTPSPSPTPGEREPGSDDDEEEIAGEPLERVWCYDPATGEQLREEPKASRNQIARIHILRVECGLTEDEYKTRIKELFCKESTGELSVREASVALDKLEERKKRWGGAKERQARETAKNARKAQRAAPENVPPEMVELFNEHPSEP
jgi:hypothetical protein